MCDKPIYSRAKRCLFAHSLLSVAISQRDGIPFKIMEAQYLKNTTINYVGSIIDKRSKSGYSTVVGRNPVMWKSKKQNIVAWPNVKREF